MREMVHRFRSSHTINERSIWIREPVDTTKPYDLVIFLDAELYREKMDILSVLTDLERRHFGNTLFVFVSYESVEARWRECPCNPPFARFILQELMPWIGQLYPHTVTSRDRVLIGLSYTGLAAAYVALQSEGLITSVIAQSGSFWSNDCWLTRDISSRRCDHPMKFYLEVGSEETAVNVQHKEDVLQMISQIESVKRFREALVAQGHEVKHHIFEGGHDFACWKQTLPIALRWVTSSAEAWPASP